MTVPLDLLFLVSYFRSYKTRRVQKSIACCHIQVEINFFRLGERGTTLSLAGLAPLNNSQRC